MNGKGGDDRSVRVFVCVGVYVEERGRLCARGRCGRILARGSVLGGEPYDTSSEERNTKRAPPPPILLSIIIISIDNSSIAKTQNGSQTELSWRANKDMGHADRVRVRPVCVMRYASNVRVLCKEQPLLATALPVLDGHKLGRIDSERGSSTTHT